MTTATSSFKRTFCHLYRSTLRRCLPLGIFSFVLMAVAFPLMYAVTLYTRTPSARPGGLFHGFAGVYPAVSSVLLVMLNIVMPVIFAALCFSYLHSRKATDVYHAVPLKRQGMFAANYLAGLTLLWAPLILCFLAVLLIGGMNAGFLGDYYQPLLILWDLGDWLVASAAVYTLSCLVAVLVGTTFDAVIYALAMNGMYPVILFFIKQVVEFRLLGFDGSWNLPLMGDINLLSLSPFTLMIWRVIGGRGAADFTTGQSGILMESGAVFQAWAVAAWLALTVAAYFLAVYCYRRRRSELAGRTTTRSGLNKIVKYVVTFVFGLLFGLVMAASFDVDALLSVFAVVGGAIAYTAFEAITARGFKTFPKAFLHMGISVAATLVFVTVVMTGFFGYETRIPAADQVARVSINYHGQFRGLQEVAETGDGYVESPGGVKRYTRYYDSIELESPEAIQLVLDLHRRTVADFREGNEDDIDYAFRPQIRYERKDGSTMTRVYKGSTRETLDAFARIENLPEYREKTNPAAILKPGELTGVWLTDRLGARQWTQPLTKDQQGQLLEALWADSQKQTVEDMESGRYPAVGYLELKTDLNAIELGKKIPSETLYLITEQHQETLALLERWELREKLSLDEDQIKSAVVYGFRSDWEYVGGSREWPYFILSPTGDARSLRYLNDRDYLESNEMLLVEDPDRIGRLLAAGQNHGDRIEAGYLVCFQYEGSEEVIPLVISEENLPQELRETYERLYGKPGEDRDGGEASAAEAETVMAAYAF